MALSVVGYAGLVWVVLAPLLAIWTGRRVLGTTLLTAGTVWAADLIATGSKALVDRPRPFEELGESDPLLGGTVGASFPSGHAATSFAGAVLLAVLIRRAVPLLFLLAVLIAFSRVYVGVHYPLDVVGGAVLGSAVAFAALAAVRALRRTSAARPRSAGAPPPG